MSFSTSIKTSIPLGTRQYTRGEDKEEAMKSFKDILASPFASGNKKKRRTPARDYFQQSAFSLLTSF
jgi:hypothetical protein